MVHPYLRRRAGTEPIVYPHTCLEPVLRKTLGVPLFQEQVIRLAMVAADYTPGEADRLRRDMAAWRRTGRIERHRERLVRRMCAKGIERKFAENVFEQIRGFGEYGFPESHAASFALIAYATAWMKCHYPEVFACALLNAQPMGFYAPSTIVEDAKRHDVEVRPVDVQHSAWDCTLEPRAGRCALRLGSRLVKGLGRRSWQELEAARAVRAFATLEDLVERTALDEGTLSRLAEAGAFESLEPSRRGALWRVRGAVRAAPATLEIVEDERRPALADLDALQTISWDYRTAGASPRGHPLAALRRSLRALHLPDAEGVAALGHGQRVRYAGLVICRQRPGTASGVVFMTLEDETGFVNVVVWSRVFDEHAVLIKTRSFLGVTGTLQVQDGVTHVVASDFWVPRIASRPPGMASRDFH
jgi:error-prone DNA polymerase